MFTIKHVGVGGDEELLQVDAVRYTPACETHGRQNETHAPATVWVIETGSIGERPLNNGTIFVMNQNGKTVARYDLGASPVPIVGDGLSDPRHHAPLRNYGGPQAEPFATGGR